MRLGDRAANVGDDVVGLVADQMVVEQRLEYGVEGAVGLIEVERVAGLRSDVGREGVGRQPVEEEVNGDDLPDQGGVVLEDPAVADVEHPPGAVDLALDRIPDQAKDVEPGGIARVLAAGEEVGVDLGRLALAGRHRGETTGGDV